MEGPSELSLAEIRQYMLANGCKVTNHALVKHFKRFLTDPATQNESRKLFKTYVNLLATIKLENNQKYLILRKKFLHECPSEEFALRNAVDSVPVSPGGASITSDGLPSPYRQPPPYKPPPQVGASPKTAAAAAVSSPIAVVVTGKSVQSESVENYRECVNEFAAAVRRIEPSRAVAVVASETNDNVGIASKAPITKPPNVLREISIESGENKENIARFSFSSGTSSVDSNATNTTAEKMSSDASGEGNENPISVKEATKKFNRMASEEEAKIISPPAKKKPDKQLIEEKMTPEVSLSHPKAKEWIVSMAKANYQELAKLASEYPELVKLQDPTTGYTALHWAAKHGNEDVVKLIAGSYKADVNARTNGGYTPLHLAMQFGRDNIFELLCNVYKANRDLMDWSGNKPLDYRKQRTSVSASTYSKIKARRKHTEKDLGFLRIGSLNVRVKKTTEAFSNFLGVGNGNGSTNVNHHHPPVAGTMAASHQHHHHHQHHHRHHYRAGTMRNPTMVMRTTKRQPLGTTATATAALTATHQAQSGSRASVPINITNKFDKIHKTWGSADNIPQHSGVGETKDNMMPPPAAGDSLKKRNKSKRSSTATLADRDSISSSNSSSNLNSGYSSMPTTPNQLRAPIGMLTEHHARSMGDSDSDSACGFGSNWSVSGRSSIGSSGGGGNNAHSNASASRYA